MINRIRKESWKNLKLVLLLVLAISMSLSLSGVTFADDDSICCETDKPEDAPPPDMLHAPSPTRSESLASASSSSNIQTFRTDTGPELDWYQPCNGGDNEIDFNISVQGIDLASVELARLTLAVWDVDYVCGGSCCERDSVYINGHRLTTPMEYLTGADQQWSTVTFNVDPAWIVDGNNYVQIFIDLFCSPKPYWCVTCDWGELSLELEEVDVKVDEIEALYDISIRDNSGHAITDPIWSEDNPSLHKSVADASKDSWWIFTWGGSLKIKTHLDAEPSRPSWNPKCKYAWWILGTNESDTGEFTGWNGEFTVSMPEKVGKYELMLMYKIYDDQDNQINFQSMTHDLYVTYKDSKLSNPKTNWLDKGCAWASGASDPTTVVTKMNSNIYNNSSWIYTYPRNTWSQLVEGSGTNGDCVVFAQVWSNLSKCLGVDTSLPDFYRGANGHGLVTITPATALDGKPGNAYHEGGLLTNADRWRFAGHQVGQYGGFMSTKYYDPTTGNIYNTSDEYVKWDLEARNQSLNYQIGRKGSEYVKLYEKPAQNPVMTPWIWGAYEYLGPYASSIFSVASTMSSSRFLSEVASGGARFTGSHTEYGVDSDGNGIYNYFSVKAEVEIDSIGEYSIYGTLFFNGEEITSSPGAKSSIPTYYHLSAGPGIHEATLQFSGEAIYKNRKSGNYTVELRLIDNSGSVEMLSFDTSNYLYTEFGETPAVIVNCSDQGMDTNADGLYEYLSAKVSIDANLSGDYFVEVGLYAADGNMINLSSKRVALSGSEDVDVLLDGREIRMSGQDGPYVLLVTLTDSNHNQIGIRKIQTAKYSYMEFQTSTATFTGNYNDYGEDTDGDDLFDNLTIEAEVDVVENGKYTAKAILTDSMGDEIVRAEAKKNLPKGNSQIVLKFDGVDIHRHGKDGPYMVKSIILYAEDLSIVDVKSDAYTTSSYRSADFDGPSSFFQHFFLDYGEDTNSDGYYESLVVEVGVDVVLSGNYLLRGVLYDKDGKQIALADAETYLNLGSQSINLRFNGLEIYKHAVDGCYSIGYVILCTDNSSLLDSQADAYTTSAYFYKDFQHPKVFLTGKYNDYGTDTDSDGIYEYLVVDMEVFVINAGNYALNARLMDGDVML